VIEAKVRGIADYKAALLGVVPKLRKRAVLDALKAGARIVQKEARRNTPVLARATRTRTPGTLQRAISVRLSKVARQQGNIGVFVNVRPLPGNKYRNVRVGSTRARILVKRSQRGANNPNDPFYWRFVNFRTSKFRGVGFLESGARKLGDALTAFEAYLGPRLAKLNTNPKDPL
jgi:HK97 gp10 family phage protein